MAGPPKRPPYATPATLWVMHAAFMVSIPGYFLVLLFVTRIGSAGSAAGEPWMPVVFGLVSLALVFAAWRVPDLLGAPEMSDSAQAYLDKRFRQRVIADGLLEAIAGLGLAGALTGWLIFPQACVFLGASLLFMAGAIPQVSGWMEEYRARKRREA